MLTVAIVGKPNVGKSTLFNRIIQKRKSITLDSPGVTRDRIYDTVTWLTKKFELIDTGGISNENNIFQKNINEQVDFAIDEAQLILFVISYKEGIDSNDQYIAKLLKKNAKNKKVMVVVNKSESTNSLDIQNQYYGLGFGKPTYVSSEHGIGIGDLLDNIIKESESLLTTKEEDEDAYKFCIIGRPNVGKSSLVNSLLNENKVIVSDIPGSTRDSTDNKFVYNKKKYIISDTAGIRRKGKIQEKVEKYSILRAEMAIAKSKLIILMLDCSEDFKEQDEVIGGLAYKANIPTIIIANKWDLVENKTSNTMEEMTKKIRSKFKFLAWAPIIFISALDKKRIHLIFNTISEIEEQLEKHISTSILNEVVLKAQMMQQAPIFKGQRLTISYLTQVKSQIPTFVVFCNNTKYLHFSYARYIENKIRETFGLNKIPVTLYWKNKNARERNKN